MTEQEQKLELLYDILNRAMWVSRLGGLEAHARECDCKHHISELTPANVANCSYVELKEIAKVLYAKLDRYEEFLKKISVLSMEQCANEIFSTAKTKV